MLTIAIGRQEEAEQIYKQALQSNPDFVRVLYNLAGIYNDTRRDADAIETLKQAIKIKPDFAIAHNNMGYIYKLTWPL